QNYSKFSCFWETEPVGCRRISCDFFHRKPRNINGLYLPPSNNAPLKPDVQGGILHPAHRQDSLRNQENVLVPIHPPLIINLSDEEDDEEDEEEDDDEEDNCDEPRRSAYVVYRTVIQKPKFNGSTGGVERYSLEKKGFLWIEYSKDTGVIRDSEFASWLFNQTANLFLDLIRELLDIVTESI
ncbi:hypothetical protein IHE44_0012090, partial [Lamprotornis superbus]